MTMVRSRPFADSSPRAVLVRVLGGFLLAMALAAPVQAQLLPEGFFDMQITPGQGSAAVEADYLNYDARNDIIAAQGNVLLAYGGSVIRADEITYNQASGEMLATGNVVVRDQDGTIYEMDRLEITDGMKEAFLDSLTITTAAGARITARDAHFTDALYTILNEASYSPCGLCIDEKGRRIGWKVKAARIIYDRERASVTLEQPSLELLGIPVAWIPWFWVPDPTQPRATGLRMPSVKKTDTRGIELIVPFFVPAGEDLDILLKPTLMTRQGFLARGELTWRVPQFDGVIEVKASGLRQMDRSAFAGQLGDRDWRGAIQTSGRFTPIETWTAGWSYSVFTDNAYLSDYELTDDKSSVNQVYATHLSDNSWIDARIQRFNRIGNVPATDDMQQGLVLPKIEAEHVQELQPGWGRVHLNAKVIGINRQMDQTATYSGVPYVHGYEGTKVHGMVEGAWENQHVLPGGLLVTPYLGARLDASYYNRTLGALPAPYATQADAVLFNATPIAALDMRWPLMATDGDSSVLFEPIAQLVFRGSGVTNVGITNDDAHSFVFDTSNLFSYNRFTGIDRQETGLRANIGGHLLGNFSDGSWLDLVAGQSFHLAGTNALGIGDAVQVGTSTGLGTPASFIVASAQGGFSNGISGGAKVQVDPSLWRITRAGVGVKYAPPEWFTLGVDYIYVRANPALGVPLDEHDIVTTATVGPFADYYTLTGGVTWNLRTAAWSKANVGVLYDDGYLGLGGSLNFSPGSWGFGFNLNLKGPDGKQAY